MNDGDEIVFWVSSGFGHNTQRPFVQVVIDALDASAQMSPAEARSLALNLLEAAEAAESDAFLVTFLRDTIGAEDRSIASILTDFRQWRESQRNTPS